MDFWIKYLKRGRNNLTGAEVVTETLTSMINYLFACLRKGRQIEHNIKEWRRCGVQTENKIFEDYRVRGN